MSETTKIAVSVDKSYLCILTGRIVPDYQLTKHSKLQICPICGARALPGRQYYVCPDSCTPHPSLAKNRCHVCSAPAQLMAEFDFGKTMVVIEHGSEI